MEKRISAQDLEIQDDFCSEIEVQKPQNLLRATYERGMATAEYAVGILAAVSLALVLLKIITNEDFFSTMLKVVLGVLGKVSGMLP